MKSEKHNVTKYRTGCRCEICRADNARYQREYQARIRARLAAVASPGVMGERYQGASDAIK